MTTHDIETWLHATPFVSFTAHLSRGRSFLVDHPEFAMLSRAGQAVTIEPPDGPLIMLNVLQVTHLESHPFRSEADSPA